MRLDRRLKKKETFVHEHLQSSEENLRTLLKDYSGNNSKAGAYDIFISSCLLKKQLKGEKDDKSK